MSTPTPTPSSKSRPVDSRGIDLIPPTERHGSPRDVRWMWAGGVFNVQMVAFGALVPLIGLSFLQSVVLIVIGNLSWLACGAASLPGPAAGTTTFVIQRAPFGVRGARVPALLNWITQVIFEISGFVLAVLAVLALLEQADVTVSTSVKWVVIVVAAIVQFALPALGHGFLLKALKLLVVPFLISFAVMTALTVPQISHLGAGGTGGFAAMTQGLALVLALSGFSWMANGADYTRYLPATTSRRSIVANVSLGGAIPMTLLMLLGAAISSISDAASNPISGLPTIFPAWFVVPYLIIAVIQLLALTSIDLYSSGVTLQALGLKLSRSVAVAVDLVLCSAISAVALFSDSVFSFISTMLLFVMVWLAAWGGIFLTDYVLRRGRYDALAFFSGRAGIYWRSGGFNVPGLIALGVGVVVSLCWINTTVFVGPISAATGGSDLSTPIGFIVGGSVYWLLARRSIVPAPAKAGEIPSGVTSRKTPPGNAGNASVPAAAES
jgi:nucleobase:cation symporter-1, NCS1 family